MAGPEGGLFAAQDADSEGVEGKYYVWTPAEIRSILGKDAEWYLALYNPQNKGFWEHDQWILLRDESWEAFADKRGIPVEKIATCNELLLAERKRRIPPGTDTKCLTAWNALTITGLTEAYRATGETSFLSMALKAGNWIRSYQLTPEYSLFHTRQNGRSFIDGFLDDYAFTTEAFIQLYQATADEDWLQAALALTEKTLRDFHDPVSGMFFFTPQLNELIARKMELNDNVIPATNSAMANNLLSLAMIFERTDFEQLARQQLQNLLDGMEHYGSGYSNWALLLQRLLRPRYCLHVHGSTTPELRSEIGKLVSPQVLVRYEAEEEAGFVLCGDGVCSPKVRNLIDLPAQ
jgi:hypothetical protein